MKIKDVIRGSGIAPNEARILLAFVLAYPQEYLLMNFDKEIASEKYDAFCGLVERRKNHEPIAYIIGKKEFYSRDFVVDSSVLIPRPDSEVLVDVITNKINPRNDDLKILELGVGSGCLILTLLQELPNAIGIGIDISEDVIKIATKNMEKFELQDRCKIYQSNWFEKVEGKFDIIISNPPYINKDDQDIMAKETILHEPVGALYSEEKGLSDYKKIAAHARDCLKENGSIFLEIGVEQKDSVVQIFEKENFVLDSVYKDLGGIERVVSFIRYCEKVHRGGRGNLVV